jgi:hypothetical protein
VSVADWFIIEPGDHSLPNRRHIRTDDLDAEVQVSEWGYGEVGVDVDGKLNICKIRSTPYPRTLRLDVERLPDWGYVVAVNVVEVEDLTPIGDTPGM